MADTQTKTDKNGDDGGGTTKPLTPDQKHKNYLADLKRLEEEHADPTRKVG